MPECYLRYLQLEYEVKVQKLILIPIGREPSKTLLAGVRMAVSTIADIRELCTSFLPE